MLYFGKYFSLILVLGVLFFIGGTEVKAMQESEIFLNTDIQTEIVQMPKFQNITSPKEETFQNPETVAGDEEIVIQKNELTVDTPSQSTQQGITSFQNVAAPIDLVNANINQGRAETDEGEVLSQQTTSTDTKPAPVTIEESKVDDKPVNQSVNNPKVYWWYLIAGTVAFVGLVALIFIARR